jgi:hypothetical protein
MSRDVKFELIVSLLYRAALYVGAYMLFGWWGVLFAVGLVGSVNCDVKWYTQYE